jgi:hypothetical protein
MRFAVTLFALLAFAFQSYVTQTHIHTGGQPDVKIAMDGTSAKLAAKAKPDKYPANQDPSNCPICQEIVHSGSFISPAAIAALPPSLAVSVIAVLLDTVVATPPASHSWRGRAPPRV